MALPSHFLFLFYFSFLILSFTHAQQYTFNQEYEEECLNATCSFGDKTLWLPSSPSFSSTDTYTINTTANIIITIHKREYFTVGKVILYGNVVLYSQGYLDTFNNTDFLAITLSLHDNSTFIVSGAYVHLVISFSFTSLSYTYLILGLLTWEV